ncbi:hypothetical protein EKE94_11985 [Mesobaculum littorinae]|uniref:Uncharacterized protein n=1 Tax=Mesobaculum littorinae TaxID=2486419 RepID=A0A438AHF6_9RHOB|nr:hypothetical protein [Mesobaculum littorinae]RVV98163.1 hypothetical protein EKE94_11985 [Mesobaculum littorinae]
MISRLTGAVARGFLVMVLIATPSLMGTGITEDGAQVVSLVALAAAILTISEYASAYPCLYEFRDAPPFNRIRFGSLFATVFLLSIITRGLVEETSLTLFVQAVGGVVGKAMDFPYSPVQLAIGMLPDGAPVGEVLLMRAMVGMAFLAALLSLSGFVICCKVKHWPLDSGRFNVWINLPTFDPTSGGDVVDRLRRDSMINVALGFFLPFVMPMVIVEASSVFGRVAIDTPQTLVWTVAAWAFLPTSLFMRGIAMGRVARIIARQRQLDSDPEGGLVTA